MSDTQDLPFSLPDDAAPARAISFVTVWFSDEIEHNLKRSPDVVNPLNELIVIDNRMNLFYPTLSAALMAGIARARHDLVALIHEDVLLVPGWQARFEASLRALEAHDPHWGMVGAVGWDTDNRLTGIWSDPARRMGRDTLDGRVFAPVERLDEQLLVLRRPAGLWPDPQLPSIHNLGRDLAHRLQEAGRATYALDAPTIHKWRGADGTPITRPKDSPKIQSRRSRDYLADKAVSDAWITRRLGEKQVNPDGIEPVLPEPPQLAILDRPVIFVGRGGGGTRLVSTMAEDCGLFMGHERRPSGDTQEMVPAIYRSVFRSWRYTDGWSRQQIIPDLRRSAAAMLDQAGWPEHWGFKLPESALILPELDRAFPDALWVEFHRDPTGTVFRRSHMSARLDNHIGRTALAAAYDHSGRPRTAILTDSELMHMGLSTRHQLDLIAHHRRWIAPHRWLRLSFEETLAAPRSALARLAGFLGVTPVAATIAETADPNRGSTDLSLFPDDEVKKVLDLLAT